MSKNTKDLTQRKKIAALLLGRDVQMRKKQVAQIVGVSPETISRWQREEAFQQLVREESETSLADVRSFLNDMACLAAVKLLELLACGRPSVEFRAASDILDRTGYARREDIGIRRLPPDVKKIIHGEE